MSVPGNSKLSERMAVLAVITPVTLVTSALSAVSSYVNLGSVKQTSTTGAITNKSGLFHRYLASFIVGDNGTGTVTVSVYKASDTNGTGSTAIYTAAYAATNGDNLVVPIDINADNVDTSKPYIAMVASIDSGSCPVSGLLQGGDGRYETAATYNTSGTVTPLGA